MRTPRAAEPAPTRPLRPTPATVVARRRC